jgi:hypothetical protein
LPDIELTHIYERIIDVMRALQKNELASERNAQAIKSGSPATGLRRGGDIEPGQGSGAEAHETGNKQ